MNILFICTSNKDRSPALEEYFKANYPQHEYRSAGINKYFTTKKGTHYLTQEDVIWTNLIVYAEDIHRKIAMTITNILWCTQEITLNLGEYKEGQVGEDYLTKAELKLEQYLK